MSTKIGDIREAGPRKKDLSINCFFGGKESGLCLQLTQQMDTKEFGYVQLSTADIIALLPVLKDHIDRTMRSKKAEAEKAIQENKDLVKTIVEDMRTVSEMAIAQPILDIAALLMLGQKSLDTSDADISFSAGKGGE